MIVCPLCENQQPAGDACDVCGRPFPADVAVPVPVAPAEGLEATRFEAVAVTVGVLPELEPTHHQAALEIAERVPDLEPTLAAPIPDVPGDGVPDLEPTSEAIPGDAPTPFPVAITCRYCRNPAHPGERLCAHCGMRLPVAASAPAPGAIDPDAARLCGCGNPIRGPVCPACGARAV
ncbi:MAG: hypothetical protein QM704_19155 [Anaeromyxobacteraceae bacterium]